MEDFLTFEVRNALVEHMNDGGSKEVCGVIRKTKDGFVYERSDNVTKIKDMDAYAFDGPTSAAIYSKKSSVVAFCHSHPNGPLYPSVADQGEQISVGKPAVIVARDEQYGAIEVFSYGDHLLDAPLMNRRFRHYAADCYEALRSWVWQNEGRRMDPFVRDDAWWKEGGDLYEEGFASQGYIAYEPEFNKPQSSLHPRVGDVILMQLDAPVINHAAIYIGNNQIYHHRMGKRSGNTTLGYLLDNGYVRKWLRHGEIAE